MIAHISIIQLILPLSTTFPWLSRSRGSMLTCLAKNRVMSHPLVRRLRPYLFHSFRRSQPVHGTRAFSARRPHLPRVEQVVDTTHDYEKRVAQLAESKSADNLYPRLPERFAQRREAISRFKSRYGHVEPGQTLDAKIVVAGRVKSLRISGSKLVFIDISDDIDQNLQVVCRQPKLAEHGDVSVFYLKAFARLARRGDWLTVTGQPHRTTRGELSVMATEMPQLLSPSLHQIPEMMKDPESKARNRHVDTLVNTSSLEPLLVRHHVESQMMDFFNEQGFVKVNTPILTAGAGGAVARPFETVATELEGQTLNLRIAPELWLKRLVVGGLNRVYEIGPAFRNEGVDATHNPEFAICEFYEAFATLEDLMSKTEDLFSTLAQHIRATLPNLPKLKISLTGPYKRLEFLPALASAVGEALPDLSSPDAQQNLLALAEKVMPNDIPAQTTLPRLLDALSAHFLEPQCQGPTFITHHPACLSPLSKHFVCDKTGEVVAARAELFIAGREYANMYEEENSPFEQRKKFERQVSDGDGESGKDVDEGYVKCLEWGLPPTGGWGCGIDRVVMLLSGRERMADVLAFGSLRNVVGLGKR